MRIPKHFYLVGFLCLCLSSCFSGQRLLKFEIVLNGKVVCEGMRSVPDSTPTAKMWDVLGEIKFKSTNNTQKSKDSFQILEGDLLIRIKHTTRELDSKSLKTLKLQTDDKGESWKLGTDEVKRIQNSTDK